MPGLRFAAGSTKMGTDHFGQLLVVLAVPGFIQFELFVEHLFEVRQDVHRQLNSGLPGCIEVRCGRKALVHVVVVVHRQGDLLEVVDGHLALGIAAGGLNSGHQRLGHGLQRGGVLGERDTHLLALDSRRNELAQLIDIRHGLVERRAVGSRHPTRSPRGL